MEKGEWFKEILKAPIEKCALLLGCFFILLAFTSVSHGERWVVELSNNPNWIWLLVGFLLIAIPLIQMVKPRITRQSQTRKITDGFRIQLAQEHVVDVVIGAIEDVTYDTTHGAVVLPANTSFDDECIHDQRTALGAFFHKHLPGAMKEVQQLIKEELRSHIAATTTDGTEYSPGTTVVLDKPLGIGHQVMITGVTRYSPLDGIRGDTLLLVASLKSIFKTASQRRVSDLFMPVLGTGHGGLDFATGLALILLQSAHCIRHERAHHIKHLTLVVFDPEGTKRKQVEDIINLICPIL